MTVLQKSLGLWISGAVVGAVVGLSKKPVDKSKAVGAVLGAFLGAITVGGIGDSLIERYDPNYTGY